MPLVVALLLLELAAPGRTLMTRTLLLLSHWRRLVQYPLDDTRRVVRRLQRVQLLLVAPAAGVRRRLRRGASRCHR